MTDFRDLAKQAKTAHEEHLAKNESHHLAKSEAMAAASDHLRSQVLRCSKQRKRSSKKKTVSTTQHLMPGSWGAKS